MKKNLLRKKNLKYKNKIKTNVRIENEESSCSDDSNDEAPQSVSFNDARNKLFEERAKLESQLHEIQQCEKLKRRLRDEKNKEQKKIKLEKLEKLKLTDEALNEITAIESLPISIHKKINTISNKIESLDFIPIKSEGNVNAVYTKYQINEISTNMQKANEFKQKQIFGPRISRRNISSYLSIKCKRKAMKIRLNN